MILFDPTRPMTPNGLPMLLWKGKAIGPVPDLSIRFISPETIQIHAHIIISPGTARYYSIILHQHNMDKFLTQWQESPEFICENLFKWTYDDQPVVAKRPPTLDQLMGFVSKQSHDNPR